jgi:hypothetical protein
MREAGVHNRILVPLDGSKPEDVGLIAMFAHKRSGAGRWVYSSVAEMVLLIRVRRDEL